jgi:pimeloyl-ACP methyl ester carboxylesterase
MFGTFQIFNKLNLMNLKPHIRTVSFVLLLLMTGMGWTLQAQPKQFSDLEYSFEVYYQEVGNGQRLAFIDEGEGPTVILIHGLGSYIQAWKQNIPELSKQHRVIALDLPGFGKSSKDVEEYSIAFFAQTVADLQDSLGISNAVWVGHSMGGQIAMQGALNFPEKISKLVLLAPAGFEAFTEQEGALMTGFVTPESIKATPDNMIRLTFKTTFYDFPESARFMADDRIAIRQAKEFEQYARAYAESVKAMLEGSVLSELGKIRQPTLIIYGKQDALIPNKNFHPELSTDSVAAIGNDRLPYSRLKMVDKAGHFVHFEQREIVNEAILNFIEY